MGHWQRRIPVAAALARGVAVARSPAVNAPLLADLTLGLMLACLRRIIRPRLEGRPLDPVHLVALG